MKYLTGIVMNKKASLAIIFLLIFPIFANADITIPIPGQVAEDSLGLDKIKTEDTAAFVPGQEREDQEIKTKKTSVHFPNDGLEDAGLDKEVTLGEELKNYGILLSSSREGGSSYERLSDKDLLYRFQGRGKRAFSFFYIRDQYDVTDTSGVYERTFGENVPKAMRGGSIHMSFEKYWLNDKVFLGWGMAFGVGLAQGNGFFTSNGVTAEQSNTTFSLWTIPVDIGLIFEVPLGNWFKIGIGGGPSAMGLYQNRDDKDNGDNGKRVRQVSWGYYGRANLKISMSHLMPNQAVRNMKAYQMTKMYLTLEARVQDFSNFQDEVSISGSSFGLGFSFEYL